jgi:dihydrofolate synthase / folylpolyglutamate synthase
VTMSIDNVLRDLYARTMHAGIKPGLDRIATLCESVGNPHLRLNVIHIAGTNGKGSTSAMLSSILQEAGYTVGLYTSPHIVHFRERIRINDRCIDDADVERMVRPLLEKAEEIGGTFFEITTALALQYFAEKRVDVAIVETGLGGRLDATNIVTPLCSVITSIDFDHMEYLGNTLEKIAMEKAGIIKQGAFAIVGPLLGDHDEAEQQKLRAVFSQRATEVGTTISFADDVARVDVDAIHADLTMSVSVIDGDYLHYYDVGLAGRHQARNVATVLATLPGLSELLFVNAEHIRDGLRKVRTASGLTGRITALHTSPAVVLDVSHNPSGIAALRSTLREAGYHEGSWHVVFGAMQDKDVMAMLTQLRPLVQTLHLCAAQIERATHTQALEQLANKVGYRRISTHGSVADAVAHARSLGPTLICGSFYVAGEAMQHLQGASH